MKLFISSLDTVNQAKKRIITISSRIIILTGTLTKGLVKPYSPPIRSKKCFKRIFYNRLLFFLLIIRVRARSFTLRSTVPFILLTRDNTYVRYCTIILFFLICSIVIENLFKRMHIVTSTYVPIIFYDYIFYFTFVSSIGRKKIL